MPECLCPEELGGACFEELHDAVDTVGRVFRKYANVLTASTYIDLEPVIQHDWRAIFRQPWAP
jgi:hypothetical protein